MKSGDIYGLAVTPGPDGGLQRLREFRKRVAPLLAESEGYSQ